MRLAISDYGKRRARKDTATFTFTVTSKAHGSHVVVAPARFMDAIESHGWCLAYGKHRAEGRRLAVRGWFRDEEKMVWLHRYIWKMANREATKEIDHIDGNPLNNSEENLRAATPAQNRRNRPMLRTNTSGITGVTARDGKFIARIRDGVRVIHLGRFSTAEEARQARNAAVLKYHGEFGVLS
jgi:hypothetical protein